MSTLRNIGARKNQDSAQNLRATTRLHPRRPITRTASFVIILALSVVITPMSVSMAESQTLPVASVTIYNNSALPKTGYDLVVWRYSETGGTPALVGFAKANASQTVNFFDQSLASYRHQGEFVHYSMLAIQRLANGSWLQLANYYWASLTVGAIAGAGGRTSATQVIAITQVTSSGVEVESNDVLVPYATPSAPQAGTATTGANVTASSSTSATAPQAASSEDWPVEVLTSVSTSSSSPQPSGLNGCYSNGYGLSWCWNPVKYWYNVWTSIGEATGSGYMIDTFSYGVGSASQLGVAVSAGGAAWSISGSWTLTNGQSAATIWPNLQCCTNYLTNSQFNFEEDQLCVYVILTCVKQNSYQIWAPGWDGSDEGYLNAGASHTSPGDCLTLSAIKAAGYSYGTFAAGSKYTVTNSNGFTYTIAVTIGSPAGNPGSASISDTTAYNRDTTQAISFGTHYTYYYLYSNAKPVGGVNQWPVLFSTNTAAHCSS